MKIYKILVFITFFLIISLIFSFYPAPSYADPSTEDCGSYWPGATNECEEHLIGVCADYNYDWICPFVPCVEAPINGSPCCRYDYLCGPTATPIPTPTLGPGTPTPTPITCPRDYGCGTKWYDVVTGVTYCVWGTSYTECIDPWFDCETLGPGFPPTQCCSSSMECTYITPVSTATPTPGVFLPSGDCGFCESPSGPAAIEYCQNYPPIQTGFGCIPTHPISFLRDFRKILIAIGTALAFLMMIVGSIFVLTSQGNPEQTKRGKEIFTGGIIGLIFMIAAVFILELIGVDILGLLK